MDHLTSLKKNIFMHPWLAPILGVALLTLGTGFYTTLTSLALSHRHFSENWIGIISGAYYLGLFIGAYASQFLIVRLGLVRAYSFFTSVLILAILLQGLWLNPFLWCVWRMIGGYALAALFVIVESWLVTISDQNRRGRVLGLYLFVYYITSSVSQLFLKLTSASLLALFVVMALFSAFSILPVSYSQVTAPELPKKSFLSLKALWKLNAFGLLISALSGALLSILYSLYPIYLVEIGFSQSHIAELMLAMILSGALFQVPIGRLADRMNRPLLIFLLMVSTILVSLSTHWLSDRFCVLFLISCLLGAITFALYPVSINHVSTSIPSDMTVSAMAMLSVFYSAGAVIGPLIMGILLNYFQAPIFFEAISGALLIACILFAFLSVIF